MFQVLGCNQPSTGTLCLPTTVETKVHKLCCRKVHDMPVQATLLLMTTKVAKSSNDKLGIY